ncbi:MAG: DUF4364 family protein [Clostridiales bacterium]|nr:DUF4364 family protein [Clostridiales bacterium]
MAFFTEGNGRAKLLILYILEKFRTPVTREQLYTAMAAVDSTGFFEMSEMTAELEQEQYLLAVPVRQQQLLFITEKGSELCAAFEREIARSVRDEVIGYADEHRDEVRRSNCIVADARPLADGTWMLTLSMLEKDSVLFEIDLRLPDAHMARLAQRHWMSEADSIYLDLLSRLTAEEE